MSACECWVEPGTVHDGHCCFAAGSPTDCHDDEGFKRAAGDTLRGLWSVGGLGLCGPQAGSDEIRPLSTAPKCAREHPNHPRKGT